MQFGTDVCNMKRIKRDGCHALLLKEKEKDFSPNLAQQGTTFCSFFRLFLSGCEGCW